jgi:peptide/nickel transport system substrate-binding protein
MIRLLFTFLFLAAPAQAAQELRFALHHEPKTLNPLAAADDASATLSYLTAGVLVRINRLTQEPEPGIAQSWKVSADHRSITFEIRQGLVFSDGTPFSAADISATLAQLANPALHSPLADALTVSSALPTVTTQSPRLVTLTFASPVFGMERLFDSLPIVSSKSPLKERASLGPFYLDTYKPGVELLLKRNPHYWKKDAAGKQLPYLDTVRIAIQSNPEIELNRFRAGEFEIMNSIDPESYDRLSKDMPKTVRDNGPSTNVEFFWFNLAPQSPVPQYKKDWFQSVVFRHAVSSAINREDISRVVYRGHASPAVGPFSPANRFWFDAKLAPHKFDPSGSLKSLQAAGFQKKGDILMDRAGHPVEFSVITRAGNKSRERTAALIQQDLQQLGIKLNIVTLDFQSLIERLTQSSQYEACLYGLTNVDPDPNELMNVLLSSGRQHGWNPGQKTPATPWEAEIDKLLQAQAAEPIRAKRKQLFDQVQQIMRREEPYIYLVNTNSLSAISPKVQGAHPASFYPETFWNIEQLSVK